MDERFPTRRHITELSRRVVLLCPARALAVGFAVASGDLPSGLRPSAHAPARPKPILAHGVGFTASELLAVRGVRNGYSVLASQFGHVSALGTPPLSIMGCATRADGLAASVATTKSTIAYA